MPIKNRELSQFASLLTVTDGGKDILLAPEVTSFVAIGTHTSNYKLEVNGTTNIGGNLFVGDTINAAGIITGAAFYDTFGNQLTSFDSWSVDDPNIYRITGNIGIGTSSITEKVEIVGNIKANQFISTTTTESPFVVNSQQRVTNLNADYLREGTPGGNTAGDIVTNGATQTLTNKTLSSPTISGPTISGTLVFGVVNLTAPGSGGSYNVVLPSNGGTLLTDQDGISGLITTGNIENETILNEDIANATIQGAKIASSTISNGNLQNSTISGISLGSNLGTLTITSNYFNTPNISYNGSAAVSRTLLATPNNIANYIVARDQFGNFSASQIDAERFQASVSVFSDGTIGCANTITAQDFNSTSDLLLKKDVHHIHNSLNILSQLRGVEFTWIENDKKSYGVIAQELETVLPELVNTDKVKSVNYNGLVGVLIQAVNELHMEVEILKNK